MWLGFLATSKSWVYFQLQFKILAVSKIRFLKTRHSEPILETVLNIDTSNKNVNISKIDFVVVVITMLHVATHMSPTYWTNQGSGWDMLQPNNFKLKQIHNYQYLS